MTARIATWLTHADADNVPATVVERVGTREVLILHAVSTEHPNLLATVQRYEKRGWTVYTRLPRRVAA